MLIRTRKGVDAANRNCSKAKDEHGRKLVSVEEGFPKRVVVIAIIVVICLILGVFMRLVGPRGELFKLTGH